jgi:hypothetical protein
VDDVQESTFGHHQMWLYMALPQKLRVSIPDHFQLGKIWKNDDITMP